MLTMRLHELMLAGATLWLAGCGGSAPAPDNPPAEVANPAASETRPANRETERPRDPLPTPRGFAEEVHPAVAAVQTTLAAVRAGELETAYDFLPPGFQQDIDRVVRELATTVEPEVWNALVRIANKAHRVSREKKPFILASLGRPDQPDQMRALAESWDSLVAALGELLASDLADLNRLREFDSRRFLATTGNTLLQTLRGGNMGVGLDPLSLQQISVELLSAVDGVVMLQIVPPGGSAVDQVEFVSVDGHWIPRSLANSWESTLNAWSTRISEDGRLGNSARAFLVQLEAGLDRLLAAETQEEFVAVAAPLMNQTRQSVERLMQPPGPPGGVSLTISGALDDEQVTRLLRDLEQLTDEPERCVYSSVTSGGRTVIALRPVADVQRFSERLTFAADIQVDVEARTIHCRLASP